MVVYLLFTTFFVCTCYFILSLLSSLFSSFSMSAGFFVVLPWEPGKVTGVFVMWPLKSVLDLVRDCNPKFFRTGHREPIHTTCYRINYG